MPTDFTNDGSLYAVFAQFIKSAPFDMSYFDGFDSLRVLTYSASTSMIVRMLHRFKQVECVFGYEGVLNDFSEILACQKVIGEGILAEIKGLADERKQFVIEQNGLGKIKFFVVKEAVSHSKIFLLENQNHRRIITGSVNLTERAFSGRQTEEIIIIDDDPDAWGYFEERYEWVKSRATSEFTVPETVPAQIPIENVPVMQEIERSGDGITLTVHRESSSAAVPTVIRVVEKLSAKLHTPVQALARPKNGHVLITNEIRGKIIQLAKSRAQEEQAQEPTWLSIRQDTGKIILTGTDVDTVHEAETIRSDVECLLEYFDNFNEGFHGDVLQHQKDYFMFMSWLYFSPFICELRNHAVIESEYIFDYPMFAVLYGKSNCGKTRLIETLMKSMFGHWQFEDKAHFTRTSLRALLYNRKRFPVVFDDVKKDAFTQHASDVIRDETYLEDEYPGFVLSMNADDHSFSTEITKRCLMLYTKASLPDEHDAAKTLYKSVAQIQKRLSTALYHEYVSRVIKKREAEPFPSDILRFSSEILVNIFQEAHRDPLPGWCTPVSIKSYSDRKYDKIRAELRKMYQSDKSNWIIKRDEVILRVPPAESFGLRKEIPDHLKKEGSKGGNIILHRQALEAFLGISFGRPWSKWFR